ncbi:tetratricopeptide repeat protein [Alicyclobacillus fodiniaquatilis]|uniref:Tetratricopeptide repeat protein n=1 Tax=Alicyclobacillus fodiniaquatilis TaxID=1661150 RepID=A0ABW4JLE5_9BACL
MAKDRRTELAEKWEVTGDERYLDEALKLTCEALEKDPTNPDILHSYGWLNQCKGMVYLRRAADFLTQGLENADRDSWVYGKLNAQLISVRDSLKQNHISVEFYKKKLSEFPDDPRIYSFLAQCYLRADQVLEAKKVVEAGLKLHSRHPTLNFIAGSVAAREGNTDQALTLWEHASQLDPEFIDPRFSRAHLLEEGHRFEECVSEWKLVQDWLEKRGWLTDHVTAALRRVEDKLKGSNTTK